MRIVTWNVNSLKARLPRVLELLEQYEPEVVCLQETKSPPDGFPELDLAAAGYRAVHHSAGRWAGVAIVARDDLALSETVWGLAGEPGVDEARWCEAVVAGIRFASVYVPNGRSLDSPEFTRKLAFLDAVTGRVATLRGGPLVVAGDFNVAPDDGDVYEPVAFIDSTHVSADERGRLRAVLAAGDLLDAYRSLHPDEVQFTWWDYRAGHFHKGLGLRIDLVLLSGDLAPRLRACGIDRNYRKGSKPSDHAPLLVELE